MGTVVMETRSIREGHAGLVLLVGVLSGWFVSPAFGVMAALLCGLGVLGFVYDWWPQLIAEIRPYFLRLVRRLVRLWKRIRGL